MSESKSKGRSRNFATVVYPESAPENWLEVLTDFHIPCLVSPLHDKDVNADGEPKKAHYHVVLLYDGVKSDEQVKQVFISIGGVGFERVASVRGYARYLCHLDNPEKYQYDTSLVKSFCGVDYYNLCSLVIDKYVAIQDMMFYIVEHNVVSYSELLLYCSQNRFDWFRVLCDNGTLVIKEFLKSVYWTNKNGEDNFL